MQREPAPADDHLRLRLAVPGDGAACAAIYAPFVTETSISFEVEPPDAAEMAGRIARTIERTPWVVAEVEGRVRGYAYAGRWRDRPAYGWTAEGAVYVDRDFGHRGVGRATMTALLEILRVQGFHRVVAGITPPNPASVALHRVLGFERVGLFDEVGWKHGSWHGVEWFERIVGDDGRPIAIRPLPEVAGSVEVEAILLAARRHRPDPAA